MHVCLLSDGYPPWERGGAQKVAAQLARGYRRRGHRVSVITSVDDETDAGRTRTDGVGVHRLHASRREALLPYLRIHNPATVRPCRRLLARLDPDVVHAHNVHYLSTGALRAADDLGLPVIKTYHDAGTFAYGEFTAFVEDVPIRAADRSVGGERPSGSTEISSAGAENPRATDGGAVSADASAATVGRSVPESPPVPETPPAPASADAYRIDPLRQLREQGPRYFPLRNLIERRALDRCVDVGVAVSHELGRALRTNSISCDAVIHNGVAADRVAEADGATRSGPRRSNGGALGGERDETAAAFRREHGLDDARLVLFGGRTGYSKGGKHLAAAFARVAASTDRPVRLVVTGDDGYVPEIRRTVARRSPAGSNAADDVVATGWIERERLRAAFRTAAVVATPSVHLDPFPTVNLEAFAAGTPVVTSRFGGARELVDHGESGLIVDPRDTDALAAALSALVDRPALARAYGAAGRRRVRRRFTVERQVEAYLDLLGGLASA